MGTAARNLGNVLYRREPKGALEVYDLGIRRLAEIPANFLGRRIRALLLAKSSYPLRSPHRGTEAKQRIDAAFVILKETKDYPAERIRPDSAAYTALCALADYQADQGELQSAIEIYKQLLDKVMASQPDSLNDLWDTTSVSRLYQALASLYRRTGGSVQAESMAARQRELWRHWNRKLPNRVFVRRQLEAASLQ